MNRAKHHVSFEEAATVLVISLWQLCPTLTILKVRIDLLHWASQQEGDSRSLLHGTIRKDANYQLPESETGGA